MTKDQIQWIREHGLTACPPGPVTTMPWHHWADPAATEDELIAVAARSLPVLRLKAGKGFADLSAATAKRAKTHLSQMRQCLSGEKK